MKKTRKNIPKPGRAASKARAYPSEKTRWAYWMQAIEPQSPRFREAFPGYHPQWIIAAQRNLPSAPDFRVLREQLLGITRAQCAAYLDVLPKTVERWETGRLKVPFVAFELLRLVHDSVLFRLSHPAWDGWFINQVDGCFVSPDVGRLDITPGDLNGLPILRQMVREVKRKTRELEELLATAQQTNLDLRQKFVRNGLVDEMRAMKDRLAVLLADAATARIFDFPKAGPSKQQTLTGGAKRTGKAA